MASPSFTSSEVATIIQRVQQNYAAYAKVEGRAATLRAGASVDPTVVAYLLNLLNVFLPEAKETVEVALPTEPLQTDNELILWVAPLKLLLISSWPDLVERIWPYCDFRGARTARDLLAAIGAAFLKRMTTLSLLKLGNDVTLTSYHVNNALYTDAAFNAFFGEQLPPAALSGVESAPYGGKQNWTADVVRDLALYFPGRTFDPHVAPICNLIITHMQGLFATSPSTFKLWLAFLPVPDDTPDLNTQAYRKVLGLIVGGLMAQGASTAEVSYLDLLYAVLSNPYYDLTPYLRTTALPST
ncbi:Hypothetical protein POVN_LOCUS292 [uncultured virus]|nr:Hypothetical protein POVN_LOCUS292 [uncultured virus]